MPVRSLNSAVFKWPDRWTVHRAAEKWAKQIGQANSNIIRIGYFGSYATGDWGVGSDLDLVIIVDEMDAPFERRALAFPQPKVPVPYDVLVYRQCEWDRMVAEGRRFAETLQKQTVWVYERKGTK